MGQLADWLLKGGVSLSLMRKGMTSAALLVPALALLSIAVTEQPEIVAVALLVVGVGVSGAANVGAVYGPIEASRTSMCFSHTHIALMSFPHTCLTDFLCAHTRLTHRDGFSRMSMLHHHGRDADVP